MKPNFVIQQTVDPVQLKVVQMAAEIAGMSFAGFVITAAKRRASEVVSRDAAARRLDAEITTELLVGTSETESGAGTAGEFAQGVVEPA